MSYIIVSVIRLMTLRVSDGYLPFKEMSGSYLHYEETTLALRDSLEGRTQDSSAAPKLIGTN